VNIHGFISEFPFDYTIPYHRFARNAAPMPDIRDAIVKNSATS
jgi:hypothetical protein